jgi:hypothetical protein
VSLDTLCRPVFGSGLPPKARNCAPPNFLQASSKACYLPAPVGQNQNRLLLTTRQSRPARCPSVQPIFRSQMLRAVTPNSPIGWRPSARKAIVSVTRGQKSECISKLPAGLMMDGPHQCPRLTKQPAWAARSRPTPAPLCLEQLCAPSRPSRHSQLVSSDPWVFGSAGARAPVSHSTMNLSLCRDAVSSASAIRVIRVIRGRETSQE